MSTSTRSELNWPSIDLPGDAADNRDVKLTPLGRRLLTSTPDAEKRLLHHLLTCVETSQTQEELISQLAKHQQSVDVLRDLAKRGFISIPEQYGVSDSQATGRWGMAAPTRVITKGFESDIELSTAPSVTATAKDAIPFTPVSLHQILDQQRLIDNEDKNRKTSATRKMLMRSPAMSDDALSPASQRLIETLQADDLSVQHLAKKYARVLNKVADAWASPERCREVFSDLLLDERGGRQGFPFEIMRELTALQEYYETMVHPSGGASWERGDPFKK